jgi:thiol-disulfide isomerase/thioredoxin
MSSRGLLVLIVALGCHRAPTLPAGDIAATLIAPAANGAAFDPASLHGKPTLVLFASITCKYCLATIPRAAAAARAEGGNALLVFVSGSAGSVNSFVTTTKFPFQALVDDGSLKQRYAIHAVPYTLVLGADGSARDALEGEQEESALRDALVAAK